MGYNPYVDENGNCVTCGTGQLNFDGKSTGCACSRVADAEYEEMQRIIKLIENEEWHDIVFAKEVVVNGEVFHGWKTKHSMTCLGCKLIALIKGENK